MITRHEKETQKSIAQRVLDIAKEQERKKALSYRRIDSRTIILVESDKCIKNNNKCLKSKVNSKI